MDELKQKFNHTDLIPSNISTSITEQDQQILSGVYLVLKKMEADYSKSPKIIRGFALREFRKSIGYKLENLILEFKAEKIMNSFKNQERVEKFYLPVTLKLKENIINTRMIIHKWVKGEENIKLAREELINRESILEKFINFFDL